jgi:hypothetical protein
MKLSRALRPAQQPMIGTYTMALISLLEYSYELNERTLRICEGIVGENLLPKINETGHRLVVRNMMEIEFGLNSY